MKKLHQLAFFCGRPLAPLYGALMKKRAAWYKSGVMESVDLPVPVVSVGNLTMGGTGKTPMAIYIAKCLRAAGYKPAIISRGYGGKARQEINIVSDGTRCLLDAAMAGDEPRLMAESLPGTVVATGVKRSVVAEYAVNKLGADVIILDDGFQHMALQRDLDLVLFKAPGFLGRARVFPGGELREPLGALGRASAFVITGVDSRNLPAVGTFSEFLNEEFPDKPVFLAEYRVESLVDQFGQPRDIGVLRQKLYGFCGLAEPGGFLRTISAQGVSLFGFTVFPDHHSYSAADVDRIIIEAEKYGCQALLTSEKDMVKLREISSRIPIYALKVELDLSESFDKLLLAI